MNHRDLSPIQQQVEHNQHAGWSWCLLHPDQIDDLIGAYQDARGRLEEIAGLLQKARACLADHHLYHHNPCVDGMLGEIEELAGR